MSANDPPDDVAVYRQFADDLTRYATALVGPTDAQDVVSDAVLRAFRSPGWPAVTNRRAYLYRSVLNQAMTHHRAVGRRRRRERVVALREPAPAVTSPDGTIDAHRALAQLSEQQRAVVYLTYWEDLQPEQIANVLDVSDGTVRKQLARARTHLRRILDA